MPTSRFPDGSPGGEARTGQHDPPVSSAPRSRSASGIIGEEDSIIECVGCGNGFVWEKGEQLFYHERRLLPPRRCKPCRDVRRAARGRDANAKSDATTGPAAYRYGRPVATRQWKG
jgi:hypothetical protein